MEFIIPKGTPTQTCDRLYELDNVHLLPWNDIVTTQDHIFGSCCFQQEIIAKYFDLTFQDSLIFVKFNTYDGKDWYLKVKTSNILFTNEA